MARPFLEDEHGVRLFVRLTPKAAMDEVEGLVECEGKVYLKARVRALPVKGAANKALEKLIAKWLKVSKSKIEVTAGHEARVKTLYITGVSREISADICRLIAPFISNDEK